MLFSLHFQKVMSSKKLCVLTVRYALTKALLCYFSDITKLYANYRVVDSVLFIFKNVLLSNAGILVFT